MPIQYPSLPDDWVWNGYYIRIVNSFVLNYFGPVAIRVAFDKANSVHHAFIPAFIIPKLHITTYDLQFIVRSFIEALSVGKILNSISNMNADEFFDLSYSTLYFYLSWFLRFLNTYLSIPLSTYSLVSYKVLPANAWQLFIQYLHSTPPP